jgi:hypothetical protein
MELLVMKCKHNDSQKVTVDLVGNCGGGLMCSIILIGTRGCSTGTPVPSSGLISFMQLLRVGQSLLYVHLALLVVHFLTHPEIFSRKIFNINHKIMTKNGGLLCL